jgi:large subunit ribosomal protein L6
MSSRIASKPIVLPAGVELSTSGSQVQIKGKKGTLVYTLPNNVGVAQNDKEVTVSVLKDERRVNTIAMAGTTRAILHNMVVGVHDGYERKLLLVGVGYRAQLKGNALGLSLGFSHPVDFPIPAGITIECPSQTEIVIKGIDKQLIGQVAANIRAYRPPEPYKGKGIRYSDEKVRRKETKKK